MKTETETGISTTRSQGIPRTAQVEEASKAPPLEVLEGEWPGQHLNFGLPASRIVKE